MEGRQFRSLPCSRPFSGRRVRSYSGWDGSHIRLLRAKRDRGVHLACGGDVGTMECVHVGGVGMLFVVRDGDRDVWVAYLDVDVRMWVYDGHTSKFHRSPALYKDFFWEKESEYIQVDVADARAAMQRGVGTYSLSKLQWLFDEHAAAPPHETLTPDQVWAAATEQVNQAAVDQWLRNDVLPALEAVEANPDSSLTAEQVRAALTDKHT